MVNLNLGPALNHLVQLEGGGFATLDGAVEQGAVGEAAFVVDLDLVGRLRLGALAGAQHFVLQAGSGGGDAGLLGIVGEEAAALLGVGVGFLLHLGGFSVGHLFLEVGEHGLHLVFGERARLAGIGVTKAGDIGVDIHLRQLLHIGLAGEEADAVTHLGVVGGEGGGGSASVGGQGCAAHTQNGAGQDKAFHYCLLVRACRAQAK